MARAPNFFVVKFRNPAVDTHDHFMVMMVPSQITLERAITSYKIGYPHLELDPKQESKTFASKLDAQAEANRLGDIAQSLNPDRISAADQFPEGEANRMLEVGKPGATPLPGTL
jgi:hypothetical protein